MVVMRSGLAIGLLLLAACQRDKPAPAARPAAVLIADAGVATADGGADAAASARADRDAGPPAQFLGTVRGIVKLAKGVQLPMAGPVLNHGVVPPSTPPCPPVDNTDRRIVARSKQTGGLSPVHVALTGMKAVPTVQPATHEIFIDACRLRPALVGAQRGDTLRVTNRSETPMVPQLPGQSFMRGMLRGESAEMPLKSTQVRIHCPFGSYCGETLVISTTHPLYAVTTTEGFFTIEQVPLDQDLRVHAWHPLFDITSTGFRLTDSAREAMVELTLTPRKPPKLPKGSKPSSSLGPGYE